MYSVHDLINTDEKNAGRSEQNALEAKSFDVL